MGTQKRKSDVWQKGTFRDKATSNSEKIKPVALSIVAWLEASALTFRQ